MPDGKMTTAKIPHELRLKLSGVNSHLQQTSELAVKNDQMLFAYGGYCQVELAQTYLRNQADRLDTLAADYRSVSRMIGQLEPVREPSGDA